MAFVVGVGDYDGKADLKNPPTDARLIHEALVFNRFEGTGPLIDPDRRKLYEAFVDFADKAARARAAGDDVIAFVYVSGHGLTGKSLDGADRTISYLIPRGTSVFDAPVDDDLLSREAFALEQLRGQLIKADVRRIVLVFDACRTPSRPRRGMKAAPPSGLARLPDIPTEAQVLTLYATREGFEAIDIGPGGRNVFAHVLADALRRRGKLSGVLEEVEKGVRDEIGAKQVPDIQGRLDFVLDPARQRMENDSENARIEAENPELAEIRKGNSFKFAASDGEIKADIEARDRSPAVPPVSQRAPRRAIRSTANLPVDDAGPWASVPIVDGQKEAETEIKTFGFDTLKAQADAGDAYAQYLVGYAHNVGLGTPTDYPLALQYLTQADANGEARAANVIAFMFREGEGVEKDENEALRWFRRAADQGVGVALANLGVGHRDGLYGLDKNRALALEFFRKGAMQGSVYALEMLAAELRRGTGGAPDPRQAMHIYHHLLANGYSSGPTHLANMYVTGEGVEADEAKANFYLRRAGELGGVSEAKWLSERAFDGIGMAAPDPALGVFFLRKAAEGGEIVAMYQLGARLRDGKDGPPQPKEAAAWFQRASNLGSVNAKLNLAKLYFEGQGVPAAPDAGLTYLGEIVDEELNRPKPEVWPMEYYSAGIELVRRLQKLDRPSLWAKSLPNLEKMYGTAGPIKRFTVPIDCTPEGASATQKTPYQVYVFDWGRPTDMVKPQLDWVVRQRGCRVSSDITDSFAKLYEIAIENKVSFTDLTVYALGTAQQQPVPAAPTSP